MKEEYTMSAEAKLLVVDDEFNILELLATSLRFAGFEVVTAGNGREAIEKAENEQPDLIVLDVMMPGMDGFELIATLRVRGVDVPVLVISAATVVAPPSWVVVSRWPARSRPSRPSATASSRSTPS